MQSSDNVKGEVLNQRTANRIDDRESDIYAFFFEKSLTVNITDTTTVRGHKRKFKFYNNKSYYIYLNVQRNTKCIQDGTH